MARMARMAPFRIRAIDWSTNHINADDLKCATQKATVITKLAFITVLTSVVFTL